MVSDGTIARLQELAGEGVELVVAAALRFGEEPFFAHLAEMGLIPAEKRAESSVPLTISGQQMARAAVNSFHPETLSYEWGAPFLFSIIPAAWWRVPGRRWNCSALFELGAIAVGLRRSRQARHVDT